MTQEAARSASMHEAETAPAEKAHALNHAVNDATGIHCRVDGHPALERTLSRLGGSSVNHAGLIDLLACPRDDPNQVIACLNRCPTLGARVLSLANSAAVGVSHEVSSMRRAVLLLGASVARQVGLAHALRASICRYRLPGHLAKSFWESAIQKAFIARKFCETVDPELADAAFTAGLIQDIGLPMLAAVEPEFYLQRLASECPPGRWPEREREKLGICHGAVGNGLLLEWGAGETVQLDVLNHHRGPASDDGDPTVVKLAAYMASTLPHVGEPTDPEHDRWMHAIFTKFLAERYPSPDAFVLAAANDAAEIIHNPSGRAFAASMSAKEAGQMIREVAGNDLGMIGRLVRLENLLEQRSGECGDLRNEAFTDPLTRLLNRRGLMRLAPGRVEQAHANASGVCCLLIDLNKFKPINDTHGHHIGDLFLKGVGKVLRRGLQRNDLVARVGGDEFVALVSDIHRNDARGVAARIAQRLNGTRLRLQEGLEFPVSASVGAAFSDQNLDHPAIVESLLRLADEAMYARKAQSSVEPCFLIQEPADPPGSC